MPLRWGIAILLTAVGVVLSQQTPEASDPETALERARGRLLTDLERLPRYTCVETITRRYYDPQSEGSCPALMAAHEKRKSESRLRGWDRLRLEVAIVDGDNVYSWVGAPRFESGTLEQLAGRGPLSSGDFGPFLHSIFSGASVTFEGQQLAGKRRLLAYSYDMPVERSRYLVQTDNGWTATAYRGVFVIDPETTDIVSLTVSTTELPKSNPDCQAINEVQYGRIQIHDRLVLVPRETRLVTIDRTGSETHSTTEYASCREYASTSRILFDASPASLVTNAAAPPDSPPATFPAGLHFRGRIITPIDSDTAAAGDPIEIVLRSPIRDKNNVELAAAGTRLHGRLVGLEFHAGSLDYVRISIQFESIELKGKPVTLHAVPDSSQAIGISVFRAPVSVSRDDISTSTTVLLFRKARLRLEKFDWGWTTLAAPLDGDNAGAH
ncbi:MAG TPA: hypothetical protein VIX19_02785 [Terriglobales bacterium]